MKTLIAIPCMDSVPSQFCQSLAMLNKVGETVLAMQMGSLVYSSRNALSAQAIKAEADYVLWIDSDMVFAPDLLERLMKTLEEKRLDMVAGLCFRRVAPYTPVVDSTLELTENGVNIVEYRDIPDKVFEVEGCGFGCVLMKTKVIMETALKTGNLFEPLPGVGEDLSFCIRARQAGFKIYCDPSVSLGHVGHAVITRQFYESFREGGGVDAGKG